VNLETWKVPWQLFNKETISQTPMNSLLVIRYPTGKCNVGHLEEVMERGVLLLNQVGTHFAEYKPNTATMFVVLNVPQTEVLIRDKQLPLD
jgi:hypothetical protein